MFCMNILNRPINGESGLYKRATSSLFFFLDNVYVHMYDMYETDIFMYKV